MWSARAVDLQDAKVPVEIVWNGGELYYAHLVVPKGAPNAKAAWQFAGFAGQAQPQANFTVILPYGPSNAAARALVPEARLRQTPAWPDNEKVMFQHDAAWLAPRLAEIRERRDAVDDELVCVIASESEAIQMRQNGLLRRFASRNDDIREKG